MKPTLTKIIEKFDKKFIKDKNYVYPYFDEKAELVVNIKSFFKEQLNSILREIVPKEEPEIALDIPEENRKIGWNDCRSEIINNIKKIME